MYFTQGSGMLILCTSIWMRFQLRDYVNMNVQGSGSALLAVACLGAVLAVAAILACCCTARGHPALLYLVIILHIFIYKIDFRSHGNSGMELQIDTRYVITRVKGEMLLNVILTTLNVYKINCIWMIYIGTSSHIFLDFLESSEGIMYFTIL